MPKSVYIHIPFCTHICAYCDFCKFFYEPDWVRDYLTALKSEIERAQIKEKIDTLYIGGGTPSCLSMTELTELFQIVNTIPRSKECEYTIECNIEHMTTEKIELCARFGINRISYGVQSFQKRLLHKLERGHTKESVRLMIDATKRAGIENINVDFIYAIPGETMEELLDDLHEFLTLDIPHISTYALMICEHTKFGVNGIEPMEEDSDALMYQTIERILESHGYEHYEVSNYAKQGAKSRHNLVYWNNETYYGFGLSASGYIDHTRYTNTRSIKQYLKGNDRLEEQVLSVQEEMENELMLGLRKLEGVSKEEFWKKFHTRIEEKFPIQKLVKEGQLAETEESIKIPKDGIYVENNVLMQLIGE